MLQQCADWSTRHISAKQLAETLLHRAGQEGCGLTEHSICTHSGCTDQNAACHQQWWCWKVFRGYNIALKSRSPSKPPPVMKLAYDMMSREGRIDQVAAFMDQIFQCCSAFLVASSAACSHQPVLHCPSSLQHFIWCSEDPFCVRERLCLFSFPTFEKSHLCLYYTLLFFRFSSSQTFSLLFFQLCQTLNSLQKSCRCSNLRTPIRQKSKNHLLFHSHDSRKKHISQIWDAISKVPTQCLRRGHISHLFSDQLWD